MQHPTARFAIYDNYNFKANLLVYCNSDWLLAPQAVPVGLKRWNAFLSLDGKGNISKFRELNKLVAEIMLIFPIGWCQAIHQVNRIGVFCWWNRKSKTFMDLLIFRLRNIAMKILKTAIVIGINVIFIDRNWCMIVLCKSASFSGWRRERCTYESY